MASKSFYTRLVSGFLFPLHEKLKKHSTVTVRQEMEKSQWWEAQKLEDLQVVKLQKFIKKCIDHVPYYKTVIAELGLGETDFKSLADLQKLPFLTKEIIRNNTDGLQSKQAIGLSRFNTGGSSGEPLIFYIGKERVSHDVAAKWRATRWWDVDIGDKEIVLWGSPIELGTQDYVRSLRDKLIRTQLLSAFELTEAKINEYLHVIKRTKPAMLFGYPSVMSMLAEYAEKNNLDMSAAGIKVAFVTSERLYDYQRALIEKIFCCPVANGYGGRDAGFIAHQCPAGEMHITAEDIIVEIVDSKGNNLPSGEEGEIVVTHLATGDFPFIRYKTGDVGILAHESCACGRGLPVLKEIKGRTTDFIYASNGTAMHGLSLIYILRDIAAVKGFKIIQHDLFKLEVQIVKNADFNAADELQIKNQLQQRLGDTVKIQFVYVDEISAEASGKYRYVINKMNP